MRRSRSQLNNLAPSGNGAHAPIGANRQTDEIQRRLNAMGMHPQQMMPEMYAPATPSHAPIQAFAQQQAPQQAAYVDPYANYASAPAHGGGIQQGSSEELDQIKYSLEQMSSKLNSLIQHNGENSPNQTKALIEQNEKITAELNEIRRSMASASNSNGVDNLARAIEASNDKLTHELLAMQSEVNKASGNSDILNQTLEARHDEVANRIAHLQDSINAAITNPDIQADKIERNYHDLIAHFSELKSSIEASTANAGEVEAPDLSGVEMRLEEITRAVVALSAGNQSIDNLDRIEARIGELAKSVSIIQAAQSGETGSSGHDATLSRIEGELSHLKQSIFEASKSTPQFEYQMNEVRQKLEELGAALTPANANSEKEYKGIVDRLNLLSEKLDNRAAVSASGDQNSSVQNFDNSAMLERLDTLVGEVKNLRSEPEELNLKLDKMANSLVALSAAQKSPQVSGPDHTKQFESLEKQLSQIVTQLSAPQASEPINFEPIAERLSGIEQQLSVSRDIAIEVATQAAQEAVELTIRDLPASSGEGSSIDPEALGNLTKELQGWYESIANANSENGEAFNAVQESLNMLAERLSNIEESIHNTNSNHTGQFGLMQESSASDASEDAYSHQETAEAYDYESDYREEERRAKYNEAQEPEQNITQDVESSKPDTQEVLNAVFGGEQQTPPVELEQQSDPVEVEQPIEQEPVQETLAAEAHTYEPAANEAPSVAPSFDAQVSDQLTAEGMNPLYAAAVEKANEQRSANTGEAQNQSADFGADPLPSVDTPSLEVQQLPEVDSNIDDVMDDTPLEPGSGAPDLAALVKQANELRKSNAKNGVGTAGSDFLASARRAAQAAAQEANMVQEKLEAEKQSKKENKTSDQPAKRKKVLMMGVAAILLTAIAIPLAGQFLGGKDTSSLLENIPFIGGSAEPAVESNSVFGDVSPTTEAPSEVENAAISSDENNLQADGSEGLSASDNLNTDDEQVDGEASTFGDSSLETSVSSLDTQTSEPSTALDNQSAAPSIDVSGIGFANEALKDAAANSDPAALFEIARRYSEGVGTSKDLAEAAKWYERSASLGFAPAQYTIGNFYEKSIGVERNLEKAVSWYELAANSGNIVAMHNLGVLYATPDTLAPEPDMDKAFRWFEEAAEHGVRDSQVNMGIFYTKGIGTEVDLMTAYKWFAVAAASGDDDAQAKLDYVKDALRPDQLNAAKSIADSWAPATVKSAANDVTPLPAWGAAPKEKPAAVVGKKTISQVQSVLARLGYKPGPADGVMGARTVEAISEYQKNTGLKATGQVDAALLKSLTKAISG